MDAILRETPLFLSIFRPLSSLSSVKMPRRSPPNSAGLASKSKHPQRDSCWNGIILIHQLMKPYNKFVEKNGF